MHFAFFNHTHYCFAYHIIKHTQRPKEPSMDLNKSLEFNQSSSTQSPQMHNFMPMSSLLLPYNSTTQEVSEEFRRSQMIQSINHHVKTFWNQQMLEIYNTSSGTKNSHQLPLARIKRVMKSDGAVKMISADAPVLFSKACEQFIMELSLRAWLHTEESKRRTLQSCDIVRAIMLDNIFGFLRNNPLCNRHFHSMVEENLSHMEELAADPDVPVDPPMQLNDEGRFRRI